MCRVLSIMPDVGWELMGSRFHYYCLVGANGSLQKQSLRGGWTSFRTLSMNILHIECQRKLKCKSGIAQTICPRTIVAIQHAIKLCP